jgi:hypothetical protein
MAAEKLLFPQRWYGGMISTHLEVIWEIPAKEAHNRPPRFTRFAGRDASQWSGLHPETQTSAR